jgi:ribose transport system ATP-binding protein
VLRVTALSKRYGATLALDGVSLEVAPGSVHALLGGNGAVKSPVFERPAGGPAGSPGGRIAAGGTEVAAERITPAWARAAGLRFVHQDLGLFEPLSVAENLAAARGYPRRHGRIDWARMRADAQAALDRLGIAVPAGSPIGALRPAERTLVAIARALDGREHVHDGVLVLDEPTARLPDADVTTLLESLRRYAAAGQAIVYVSHRLEEVLAIADRATVLRDGRVVATVAASELDEAALARLIVGHVVTRAPRARRARTAAAPALELRDVHAGPLRGVSLTVGAGEVVGVAGLVGSGRTSLLRAIYGALELRSGAIALDGRPLERPAIAEAIARGLGYVPEDRAAEGAFLGLGITENLAAAQRRRIRLDHAGERRAAAEAVRTFAIRTPSVTAPLTALSGGNQQKVVVARWLTHAPRVLLLDEPTQGVDVGARADIHAHIARAVEGGAAAVVVSSDVDELLQLADRVVVLAAGRIAAEARSKDVDRHWVAERVYAGAREAAATPRTGAAEVAA